MSTSGDVGRPSQQIAAVIFDHDGTLVDSENITLSVVAEIAINAGAQIRDDDPDRFVGADLHVVFEEIEKRSGKPLPDNIMDVFRERQSALLRDGLVEIPGARALLESITLPMAVASNAPVSKMELCLETTGMLSLFPKGHLLSAYDVNAWKPDPSVYFAAAEVLGVEPAHCAVVEDSRPGVEGALAAGMAVFALDPDGRLADFTEATRVSSLAEFGEILAANS